MLTIAGSDPSGGAGIQADIKTATLCGVHAMSVLTALTVQNSAGVGSVHPVAPDLLRSQLEAVMKDGVPDAVKIGMIPDIDSALVIADVLTRYNAKNIVVDPVMVSTSGHSLSESDASMLDTLAGSLYPLATLLTPNLDEARKLAGYAASCLELEIEQTPQFLSAVIHHFYGSPAVLVKGGHSGDPQFSEDIMSEFDEDCEEINLHYHYKSLRVETRNSHGTGCVLSSAIACGLAKGMQLHEAVKFGKEFLNTALILGKDYVYGQPGGHGPLFLIV